jgi:hypothetical protein
VILSFKLSRPSRVHETSGSAGRFEQSIENLSLSGDAVDLKVVWTFLLVMNSFPVAGGYSDQKTQLTKIPLERHST